MNPGLGNLLRNGLGWLLRLFLLAFVWLTVSIWLDAFVFSVAEHDQVIGSDPACGDSWAYCSWANYAVSLIPGTVLAIGSVVAMAWRRLRHREWVLRVLALLTVLYLVCRLVDTYLTYAWAPASGG